MSDLCLWSSCQYRLLRVSYDTSSPVNELAGAASFAPVDGFATSKLSRADFAKLGFRLAASSGTAFAAMYKAVRQSYECLAQDKMDPFLGAGGADTQMKAAQATCGLPRLLEIERRTMKDH